MYMVLKWKAFINYLQVLVLTKVHTKSWWKLRPFWIAITSNRSQGTTNFPVWKKHSDAYSIELTRKRCIKSECDLKWLYLSSKVDQSLSKLKWFPSNQLSFFLPCATISSLHKRTPLYSIWWCFHRIIAL